MKPVLVMPYDEHRKVVGDVAAVVAREWAEFNGMDFISGLSACMGSNSNPWFYKVYASLSRFHLANYGSPFFIVADSDVVFRRPFQKLSIPAHFGMSVNWAGICTGFFIASHTSTVVRALEVWSSVGPYTAAERYKESPQDEATLKYLCDGFQWIDKAIERIPTSVVSSPENGIGTLAHHFVASARTHDLPGLAAEMQALIDKDKQ